MSTTVVQQCNATIIRRNVLGNMPVFTNPAEYPGEYDPLSVSYYTVWRCWKACCCCSRGRRRKTDVTRPLPFHVNKEGGCVPQRLDSLSSSKQISMIASSSGVGRREKLSRKNVLVGCMCVMMCGVVGSCIYGIVVTEQHVVTRAVDVVETSGRGYIQSVLGDVQQTIDTGRNLDSTLSAIESMVQTIDLGLDGAVTAALSSIQQQLRDLLETAQDGVESVEEDVVGSIDDLIEEYEPQMQKYNTYRSAVMYVLFSLCIFLSLCIFVNAAIMWPFLHSLSIFLFLCLMIINFAAVIAYTAGIKVGSDTCQNIEPFLIDQVDDPGASAILRYYFNGEGTVYDVAQEAANVDIRDIVQTITSTKQSVESLIQGVTLSNQLQAQVDLALGQADSMLQSIDAAIQKIEAETVMTGPYLELRGFVCCDTLDTVGDIWLSMILMGVFAFVMLLLAFWLVHTFDALPLQKWYERYTPTRRAFV